MPLSTVAVKTLGLLHKPSRWQKVVHFLFIAGTGLWSNMSMSSPGVTDFVMNNYASD